MTTPNNDFEKTAYSVVTPLPIITAKDAQISGMWSEFFALYVRLAVSQDVSKGNTRVERRLFAGTSYLYTFWRLVEKTSYGIQGKATLLECLGVANDGNSDVSSILGGSIGSLEVEFVDEYEAMKSKQDISEA